MENFKKIQHIHFIGIYGISMSAIAFLMNAFQKTISGTDDYIPINSNDFEKIGIEIYKNTPEEVIKNAQLIVYTNAVPQTHPDVQMAKSLGKTIIERAEFLGILSTYFAECIAVAGTHGKTTTTGLTYFAMQSKNPTLHIGGKINKFKANYKIGNKHYFITESCEFNKSFLHINPTVSIITNIEQEHMDTFKTIENLHKCFLQFASQTSDLVIVDADNPILSHLLTANIKPDIVCVAIDKKSDFWATNIIQHEGKFSFDCYKQNDKLGNISLNIVGKHNVQNALYAIAVANHFKINFNTIKDDIEQFDGVERRFEILQSKPYYIIHDYAHHPTEIKSCIQSAKYLTYEKLYCIFEPHTYSRTLNLMNEFKTCFDDVDELILLPTYSAREKELIGGRSIDLFYNLPDDFNVSYYNNLNSLTNYLQKKVQNNDLVLWLGAGTILEYAKNFAKN